MLIGQAPFAITNAFVLAIGDEARVARVDPYANQIVFEDGTWGKIATNVVPQAIFAMPQWNYQTGQEIDDHAQTAVTQLETMGLTVDIGVEVERAGATISIDAVATDGGDPIFVKVVHGDALMVEVQLLRLMVAMRSFMGEVGRILIVAPDLDGGRELKNAADLLLQAYASTMRVTSPGFQVDSGRGYKDSTGYAPAVADIVKIVPQRGVGKLAKHVEIFVTKRRQETKRLRSRKYN